MDYKLSPSDLTFAYEACKRCFYLKVVNNISQPSIPLPAIFSQIASLLKNHYNGKRTSELHVDLPPGVVSLGEKYVRSMPIKLPNHEAMCYISGRFDIVISFDDGTYGVIDFKTGNPNRKSANMYGRQLHAYAYALEHAAPHALSLYPISRIGLLYFFPSSVSQNSVEWLSYESEITWVEIEKNEQNFLKFVDKVLNLLESPTIPDHNSTCQWCNYLGKLRDIT